MLKIACAALVAAFLPFGAAAHAQTREDEQVWVNVTAMGRLNDELVYFAEVQPRTGDASSRLDMLLLRGGVGAVLKPGMTLYQGYARVVTPVDGGRDTREHRSFQQLSWSLGKVLGGELSSRTRFEQRWRNDGDDAGLRLREMLRYETPLGGTKSPSALVSTELFVALNDTDWGARGGFDQIRNFVGLEIPVGGTSTLEAGYLNHYVDQPGPRSRMNHVASLTLFLRH